MVTRSNNTRRLVRTAPLTLSQRVERLEKTLLFKPAAVKVPEERPRFTKVGVDGRPTQGAHVAVYDAKTNLTWAAGPMGAGKGAGLAGARSGLWSEYHRLIRELQPGVVLVENVSALLSRGLGTVLGDLAAIGYDAEWHCIPAAYVGAPHRRDRIWIIAYPCRDPLWLESRRRGRTYRPGAAESRDDGTPESVADAHGQRQPQPQRREQQERGRALDDGEDVADTDQFARGQARTGDGAQGARGRDADRGGERPQFPDAILERLEGLEQTRPATGPADGSSDGSDPGWWSVEPDVGRVANGVPARVDRLRALGNAVVPQIPQMIGRAITTQLLEER